MVEQNFSGYNNAFKFNGKEQDPETGMSADPIHDVKGNVIGDNGKTDGRAYVVKGKVEKRVKETTEKGEYYTGDLELGSNGASVPTGNKNDEVQKSFDQSQESLRENGGHSLYGDSGMSRWREGGERKHFKDKDGNFGSVVSVEPFRKPKGSIGLYNLSNDNDIEFIWHIHPQDKSEPRAGSSNASPKDIKFNTNYNKGAFRTTIFIIGGRTNTVKFYNGKKSYMNISYDVFKKIGNTQ